MNNPIKSALDVVKKKVKALREERIDKAMDEFVNSYAVLKAYNDIGMSVDIPEVVRRLLH